MNYKKDVVLRLDFLEFYFKVFYFRLLTFERRWENVEIVEKYN